MTSVLLEWQNSALYLNHVLRGISVATRYVIILHIAKSHQSTEIVNRKKTVLIFNYIYIFIEYWRREYFFPFIDIPQCVIRWDIIMAYVLRSWLQLETFFMLHMSRKKFNMQQPKIFPWHLRATFEVGLIKFYLAAKAPQIWYIREILWGKPCVCRNAQFH